MILPRHPNDMFLFYGSSDLFSNWNWRGFVVKGIYFKTGEHFLMYCKAMLFGDKDTAAKILVADHPKQAKYLGRLVKGFNEKVWQEKRIPYMVRGCLAKADQYDDVANLLDNSGDKTIVEASLYDKIWGVGIEKGDFDIYDPNNWLGTNYLGTSYMIARAIRRKQHEERTHQETGTR